MTPNAWRTNGDDVTGTPVHSIVAYVSVATVAIGLGGVLSVLTGGLSVGGLRALLGFVALLALLPLGVAVVEVAVVAGRFLRGRRASTG